MARPLRIEFDGALCHVTSGGNAREPIFIADTNRILFLDKKELALIARLKSDPEVAKTCRWRCERGEILPLKNANFKM